MNSPLDLVEFSGRQRTPYIPQGEANECALACLAMVAGFHGYKTDLITLRQRYGMSLKGANLKQVMQVAEDIGFNARPLRGEIADLPHLGMPAILHWNLNHFVVLTAITGGIRGRRYHIHDPARGALVLSEADVSRSWTGVALDLLRSESFKPKIEQRQLNITQLWSKMTGFWGTIRQVVLLSLVMQLVVLATPFFLQISIDTVFPAFDRDLLLMLALGFGGLTVINLMASWLRSLILVTLSNSLSYQVIVNLFRHLMRLPLDYFEKRHVGDIISRFGSTQTTLMKILMGLFEPSSGAIRLGDRPISSYRKGKYRRFIGSVAQGDMLYAGSLAENIAFFDPEIDMARVRKVARMAQIDDEIEKMPMGYETLVGDMGSVLSGGQLQRVLLARALYPDPKVLILDEGTANLDAENEVKILEVLRQLSITRIAVAHRPATLLAAHRVVAVTGGNSREIQKEAPKSAAAAARPMAFAPNLTASVQGLSVRPDTPATPLNEQTEAPSAPPPLDHEPNGADNPKRQE